MKYDPILREAEYVEAGRRGGGGVLYEVTLSCPPE